MIPAFLSWVPKIVFNSSAPETTIKGKAAAPLAAVPAVVGGDLSGWKFSPVFKNGVEKSVLYSYFTNDSVIGLKVNTSGDVEMVKTIATTAGITAAGFTEFELVESALNTWK